jgi:hypothetical protein
MSKKALFATNLVTAVVCITIGGLMAERVLAAAAGPQPIPPLTDYEKSVTVYEKEGQAGGCGAPEKVLVDNEVVRVNLVSFPTGFDRCGGVKRRNNQLLVYLDPGDYTLTTSGSSGKPIKVDPNAPRKPLAPGSAVFHARDTVVSTSHVNNAYRVLFIEMKK